MLQREPESTPKKRCSLIKYFFVFLRKNLRSRDLEIAFRRVLEDLI